MDMFLALVDEEYEMSMGSLAEIAEGPGSVTNKLMTLARGFLDAFAQQSDRPNFFIVMSEVALREPVVKTKLVDMQEHYIDLLTDFIEAGIESGDLRPTHPRATAIFLKSLVDGLEGNTALGMNLDLDRLIPAGLDLLLNGVLNTDKREPADARTG
jgi:AcrR family transcriptional regulator